MKKNVRAIKKRTEKETSIPVLEAVQNFLASADVKRLASGTQKEYELELLVFARWCASHSLVQNSLSKVWRVEKVNAKYGTICLHQVNGQIVQFFVEYLKKEHKPTRKDATELSSNTLAGYVRVVKRFLNWCAKDEQYSHHANYLAIQRIQKPKVVEEIIEPFTSEQIEALFEACANEESEHLTVRDRAILSILLDSGLRATELCTLKIGNLSLDPRDPHVQLLGKGEKWGEVGIGERARRDLAKYIRQFRELTIEYAHRDKLRNLSPREESLKKRQLFTKERVFVNRAGKPFTRSGLFRLIKRLAEWADVPDAHPHRFRHTFAVLFWRRTHDIRTLSKLLRHSSIAVTENYLKSILQAEARIGAPSVLDEL